MIIACPSWMRAVMRVLPTHSATSAAAASRPPLPPHSATVQMPAAFAASAARHPFAASPLVDIASSTPREGGGGEYPLQDGFGWTNGVVRRLIGLYGEP